MHVKEGIVIPSFLFIYQRKNHIHREESSPTPAFLSVLPGVHSPSTRCIAIFTLLLTGIRVCVAIF
ncbi:hypothetical protein DXA54_16945 [Bacteroides sp. OF03-11BH]|nr:hypothetical protein DXA54_16945 [Bacteroides sp. OF03-11BH]